MITINYQSFGNKGFQLRLRLYQNGETKFINVTKLLKGVIYKRHWNQKKQQFIPSCPYCQENNDMLVQFRQKYDEMAINWNGSVFGMIAAMEDRGLPNGKVTVSQFIADIVSELKQNKHSDGSVKGSYEGYIKLGKRIEEFCLYKRIKYGKLLITDIKPKFIDDMFNWIVNVRKGRGHIYISAMLHAVVVRADKAGHLKAEDFKNCKWKGKKRESSQKHHTLTREQCTNFVSLKLDQLPDNPKSELYHDFCIFLLYTGQSPCDAIALRYKDIQNIGGVDHFVFKRRKIAGVQAVPCSVPINPIMKSIMDRWKSQAKDDYIFPIRNIWKIKNQGETNGDIKHFVSRLNNWLKKVGEKIGCSFPLHSYTFRHTSITHYISKGVPVIYVANMMGTSVKNCENIYYNNQGDVESRDKTLGALTFM